MKYENSAGIDIGTHSTKVAICQGDNDLTFIDSSTVPSVGMSRGTIKDIDKAGEVVSRAIENVQNDYGIHVVSATLCIGGEHVKIITKTEEIKAEGIIEEEKVEALKEAMREEVMEENLNYEILDEMVTQFYIDEEKIPTDPVDLSAKTSIGISSFYFLGFKKHIDLMKQVIESINLDVDDIVPTPIAIAQVALTSEQKIRGCGLLDIGAHSTTFMVYKDESPIFMERIAFGANDLTNDITKMFTATPIEAEKKKRHMTDNETRIKKLSDTWSKKLAKELKNIIDKNETILYLPYGIVVAGGGAKTYHVIEAIKDATRCPVSLYSPGENGKKGNLHEVAGAYGAAVFGLTSQKRSVDIFTQFRIFIKRTWTKIKDTLS